MNTKIRILIAIHIFFALNVNASEGMLEENIANLWINDLDHHTDVALLKQGDQYIRSRFMQQQSSVYFVVQGRTPLE